MNLLGQILVTILLPVQFYGWGLFGDAPNVLLGPDLTQSRVQGAETEKNTDAEKVTSLRGSITDAGNNQDNASVSGFLPERRKDFSPIKIFASSSVVLDVDSGTLLHYDNGRLKMPIASLTKIMTAILVVENVKNLDEPVTIDGEALQADGTKVGCPTSVNCVAERLHLGEKISAKDLLSAMLLDSANDAAVALGKHVAGSQTAFADLMNEKAKQLNLGDSHFCNPSGLDEESCYSSAYDLARIAAFSMRYDIIWETMKTQETDVNSCDGSYTHHLKNTDMLLGQISNCIGGKTGFTYNAGKSLMLAAVDPETERHRVVAVLLNDNNRWSDMKTLIDWVYSNYQWK